MPDKYNQKQVIESYRFDFDYEHLARIRQTSNADIWTFYTADEHEKISLVDAYNYFARFLSALQATLYGNLYKLPRKDRTRHWLVLSY